MEVSVISLIIIIEGVDEYVPGLSDYATREQAMKLIGTALNWNMSESAKSGFSDVSTWAEPYVANAVKLGITNGKGNGKFGGTDKLTAHELCTWLIRSQGVNDPYTYSDALMYMPYFLGISEYYNGDGESALNRGEIIDYLYQYLIFTRFANEGYTLIESTVAKDPIKLEYAKKVGLVNAGLTSEAFNGYLNQTKVDISEFSYLFDEKENTITEVLKVIDKYDLEVLGVYDSMYTKYASVDEMVPKYIPSIRSIETRYLTFSMSGLPTDPYKTLEGIHITTPGKFTYKSLNIDTVSSTSELKAIGYDSTVFGGLSACYRTVDSSLNRTVDVWCNYLTKRVMTIIMYKDAPEI